MAFTRAVFIHRLKTATYTLGSVVLISWVTDALNEGLMFKPLLRYLYPRTVQDYQHPFSDHPSLMIWLIPLLAGLAMAFASSALAVHHFKRRHRYRPVAASTTPTQVIGRVTSHHPFLLPDASTDPGITRTFHALCRDAAELAALPASSAQEHVRVQGHLMPDSEDVHQSYRHLQHILAKIRHEAGQDAALGLDLGSLNAALASAATLACQDHDIMLCQVDPHGHLRAYRVTTDMRD